MAVAHDAVGPSSSGVVQTNVTAGTIMTWSHTCGGSDRLITVAVTISVAGGQSDAGLATTATYNGVAMTSVSKVHSGGANTGYVELFRLIAPASGANNVVVSMTGTAAAQIDATGGSESFTGAHQTVPLGTVFTNTANGTSVSVNVTGTQASGTMVVDGVCAGTSITGIGGSQTSRWKAAGNPAIGAANQGRQSTAAGNGGTVAMSHTGASDFWAIIAVEVLAAAGGGTTPVTKTVSTTWDTKAAVTTTRATTWNTRAAVVATRATTWNTLAAITTTRATTWNTRAAATTTRATTWHVLARITKTVSTTWDVASSLTAVTTTRSTTWHTRALVVVTRSTTWDVSVLAVTIFRPPVVHDRSYGPERLWRHVVNSGRGVNVFQLADGSYTETEPPPGTVILHTYLGGHDNPVDATERASLIAAGYGPNLV